MIAVDAQAMGMIRTPYEAVEMVCIANHDLAVNYVDDMADELEKHGKADEYLTAVELGDTARATSFIEELIEKERIREIFLTALKETREELGVPELDPKIRRAGTLDIDPGEEEDEFEDDDDLGDSRGARRPGVGSENQESGDARHRSRRGRGRIRGRRR